MSEAEPLASTTLADFTHRLGSGEPVPGGGSASALAGALAASLVGMVAALSQGRSVAESDADAAREIAVSAVALRGELISLVDLDATAYENVVAARRLPRESEREAELRATSVAMAMADATRVPLRTAERIVEVLELAERLVTFANRNAISDLGVAARLGAAALHGALLNVRVNLPFVNRQAKVRDEAEGRMATLAETADRRSSAVVDTVERRLAEAESKAAT